MLVFALALLATGSLALYLAHLLVRSDEAAFEHEAGRTAQAMQERLDLTLTLLRGTAGLFVANDDVGASQFSAYVGRLRLRELYPGVQGIGFSQALRPDQVRGLEQRMQRDVPGFHVWPAGEREVVHSILFLEPLDARNRAALGYDMGTSAVRRAAMEAARDSGLPRASGRVTLVQEIYEEKQAGFLIYLPLYDGAETPPTVSERRARLRGFVYAPLRVGDLLRGVRGGGPQRIDYAVYDSLAPSPAALMRSTAAPGRPPAHFESQHVLHVAGREWLVRFESRPEFDALSPSRFTPLLLAAALLASGLLAGISWLQVRARRAAELLADAALRNASLYDELALAARRKDEFLAMLGHELRNPLAPIVSSAAALQRGVAPERAQRLHEIIARQARQLTHLVNDLLEASRITTGRIAIKPVPTSAEEAVRNACEALQPVLQQRGQALQVEREGQPAPLQGDPARIAQVLVNLLHNASKFSPEGGTIVLRVEERPDEVAFEVSDRGVGLSSEALAEVFELFVQAGEPDARHGGLGIGLALVRRVVELHGGSVRAHSDGAGAGATFTVTLPRRGPAAGAPRGPAGAPDGA
jgi:signal transduction histidine kinase